MGTYPTILALAAPCRPTCPSMTLQQQPSNAATPAPIQLLRCGEAITQHSASTINCQTEIRIVMLPKLHRSQTACWSPWMGMGEGLCTQLTGLVTCAACNACCTVFRLLSTEPV